MKGKSLLGGFTLVYLMIIITVVLLLGVIVLNKQSYFNTSLENRNLETILLKNINSKFSLAYNYHIVNNSDGGGFNNLINCPNLINYLSGSNILHTGSTNYFFSIDRKEYICSGSINSNNLNLYYSGTNSFASGILSFENFNLVGNHSSMTGNLSSPYSLNFSFSGTDFSFIDKNKNSDNYKTSSSGNIYYSNNQIDNDTDGRGKVFGFIPNDGNYYNIFSNTKEVLDFIDQNANNEDLINKKLSLVNSGVIYLDVDNNFDLKIVEFDKNMYLINKNLIKIGERDIYNSGGIIGYLTGNTYTGNLNGGESFNFSDNLYGFFLKTGTGVLNNYITYNLKIFDKSGSGVYIVPFKDDEDKIEYLGNDIINYNGKYVSKIYKLSKIK